MLSGSNRGKSVDFLASPSYPERVDSIQKNERKDRSCVILCDDDEIIRKITGKMIRACGYEPLLVASGSDLIQLFLDGLPENIMALIVDFDMPDMDGFSVLKALGKKCSSIPVVLTSGHCEEECRQQREAQGVSHYLMKPYSLDGLNELLRLIERSYGAAVNE
jgi:CheY-like chemotaxis protein